MHSVILFILDNSKEKTTKRHHARCFGKVQSKNISPSMVRNHAVTINENENYCKCVDFSFCTHNFDLKTQMLFVLVFEQKEHNEIASMFNQPFLCRDFYIISFTRLTLFCFLRFVSS